jgi:hypothetical protein
MKILFVTGSDAAFFNSLLIGLHSFAERMAGQRLLVCDFGLTAAQARFLHSLDVLVPCPPDLAARGTFHRKAALINYLRHNGQRIEDYNALVWLDADLTLVDTGFADFADAVAAMTEAGAAIAACAEPSGRSLDQMIATLGDPTPMAPFAQALAQAGLDSSLPYFSSGLVFCRPAAAPVLELWMELTNAVAQHPLFEQNMFNIALRKLAVPLSALDCEEWQAQGNSLDSVALVAGPDGRPAARIGDKNIKTLHTTSPGAGHLLIGVGRMTVRNLDLVGPYKLFRAEPLRMYQLQLLAAFIAAHADALLRLGIGAPAARPVEGFEFVMQ